MRALQLSHQIHRIDFDIHGPQVAAVVVGVGEADV
jgi:hypothetical protein